MKETVDFSHAHLTGDDAGLQSMTMTIELFDFGQPVDVVIPQPDAVVSLKDLVGSRNAT